MKQSLDKMIILKTVHFLIIYDITQNIAYK